MDLYSKLDSDKKYPRSDCVVYITNVLFILIDCKQLFKSKEESQAKVTSQQKTESGQQQTQHRSRSSHGSVAVAATTAAAAGSAPGGGGSTVESAVDGGDLIHLPGPLTEDAVLKALHSRFCATQMFVSIFTYMYITISIRMRVYTAIQPPGAVTKNAV